MRGIVPLLVFAIALLVACACVGPVAPGGGPTPSPRQGADGPLVVRINATPDRYNTAMSSTIGIRLTPENTTGIVPAGALFRWETSFGTFYHWGPPDFKIIELAPDYAGGPEPVYWSYFSDPGNRERKPVTITLTVQESSTGKALGNASLRIGWEPPDSFTAVVEGPP